MKPEDLMIGDWVSLFQGKIDGSNCNVQICFIGEYGEVGIEGCEEYTSANCNLLFPIHLTPEILEKNGFWCERNVGYVMEEYEYEIIYDLFDHKLRILKNREQILNLEYFDEMCVHELQHALLLAGVEKKIEL